jgi:acetylglutamate kinase
MLKLLDVQSSFVQGLRVTDPKTMEVAQMVLCGSINKDIAGLSDFNCVPVELTREDLDSLEQALESNNLPETAGFFFGGDSDDSYRQQDVEFIQAARNALDNGQKVVYDSWW